MCGCHRSWRQCADKLDADGLAVASSSSAAVPHDSHGALYTLDERQQLLLDRIEHLLGHFTRRCSPLFRWGEPDPLINRDCGREPLERKERVRGGRDALELRRDRVALGGVEQLKDAPGARLVAVWTHVHDVVDAFTNIISKRECLWHTERLDSGAQVERRVVKDCARWRRRHDVETNDADASGKQPINLLA